jgi:WD40 repeat protein
MGIFAISWSHDGTRLAAAKGNTGEIWEPATWKRVRRYTNHLLTRSVAWSPDDRRLALRGANGVVYLCNVAQEETQPDFVVQQNGISQLAWSPDGQCFATDGIDGKVRIWDVRSKQELAVFDGHQGFLIQSLDWHPRQDRLVSCDQSGVALIWSWDGKHPRQERRLDPYGDDFKIRKICWSPDGSQIAVAEIQNGFRSVNSFIRIIDA